MEGLNGCSPRGCTCIEGDRHSLSELEKVVQAEQEPRWQNVRLCCCLFPAMQQIERKAMTQYNSTHNESPAPQQSPNRRLPLSPSSLPPPPSPFVKTCSFFAILLIPQALIQRHGIVRPPTNDRDAIGGDRRLYAAALEVVVGSHCHVRYEAQSTGTIYRYM